MKTPPRIPTIIGLIVLVLGVAVGVLLVQQRQLFRLAASPQETPHDVRISNVADTSFTVSWTTEGSVTGSVLYGESSQLGQVDQDTINGTTHFATLSNLKPKTKYFFKLLSGKTTFGKSGDEPWTQTTGQPLTTRDSDVVTGTITTADGAPAAGALVYISLPGGAPLGTSTSNDGQFSLALSQARTTSLNSYVVYDKTTTISLFAQTSVSGTGDSCCLSAQVAVGNAKPIAVMALGKSYDLRKLNPEGELTSPQSKLSLPTSTASPAASPGSSGFKTESISQTLASTDLTVDNPKEGEKLTTAKPEFRGRAPAGKILNITLQSLPETAKLTVPASGLWTWTAKTTLADGSHTLTVSFKDSAGATKTTTRKFTVTQALGGTPSFTSTPSGKLATASPSPLPTTKPATATPKSSLPSTSSGMPISGNLTFTLELFILGLVTLFGGVLLYNKQS